MSVLPKRSASRVTVLIALLATALFLPPVVLRYALPALSPFMWACTLLAARALGLGFLVGLPMIAFVVWRRRAFCRFLCPMGWLVELCAKTRPKAKCAYRRVPAVGQWAALLTLGGAIASLPLFLLLDPIAMLAGAANAPRMPKLVPHLTYAGLFAIVVVLSVLFPLLWCRRLCPLGATQDLLAALKDAVVRRVRRGEKQEDASGIPLARRAFLGAGGGMAVSALAVRSAPRTSRTRLRPPGSVPERELSAMCLRCGNCVRSCPTGIIHPDLHPPAAAAFLAPTIRFGFEHCRETCNLCGQNCPTGAIAALPLEEKNACRMGLAEIEWSACALSFELECRSCIMLCTRDAIVEKFSRETYTPTLSVDKDRCTGCGVCMAVCPHRAITIVPPRTT